MEEFSSIAQGSARQVFSHTGVYCLGVSTHMQGSDPAPSPPPKSSPPPPSPSPPLVRTLTGLQAANLPSGKSRSTLLGCRLAHVMQPSQYAPESCALGSLATHAGCFCFTAVPSAKVQPSPTARCCSRRCVSEPPAKVSEPSSATSELSFRLANPHPPESHMLTQCRVHVFYRRGKKTLLQRNCNAHLVVFFPG